MSWHISEYQNSVVRFYFRVASCLFVLFSLGCSGLQEQHKLPQAPLSCLLPLFLYSTFFSSFFFFVDGLLYFGFYFQEKMRRGLQESSDNPGLYSDYTLCFTWANQCCNSWFGHIIKQSFTLSPGELRESKKSGKTLLISLQQDWRVV